MKKQILLLFLLLFCGLQLFPQERISVYFKIGKSKLVDTTKVKVEDFLKQYEEVLLDSIVIIGFSDTIGNSEKNSLLSEKRAKNVMEYAVALLPEETFCKMHAIGESVSDNVIDRNRRVEIIAYKKVLPKITKVACSQIDFELLHRINIKYPPKPKIKFRFKKTKKKVSKFKGNITIRVEKGDLDTNRQYYYANVGKDGQIEPLRLVWQYKKSGIGRMFRKRYTVKIPYLSYLNNKIFTLSESPCLDCQDTLSKNSDTTKESTCLQTDRFLMQNIQYRRLLFNPYKMLARVPKEYINFNDTYFHGCNTDEVIKWSKRSKKYSYARVRINDIYVRNITRNMRCCESSQEPSECKKPVITLSRIQYPRGNSYLHTHLEEEYNDYKFRSNIGVSVTYDSFKFHNLFFAGMNTDKQFTAEGRFQFSFFSYPVGYLMSCLTWGMLSMPAKVNRFSKYYIGCDFHGFADSKQSNISQNFNIGYAYVNYTNEAFVRRIFIQGEYWNIKNNKQGDFGIRVGILTKLWGLKKTTF